MATLKVRGGLSAPLVNAIPSTWDPQWFRRWITDFLNQTQLGAGVTDINGGSGSLVLTGTPNQINVSGAVAGTITLTFQPNVIIHSPAKGVPLTISGNAVSPALVIHGGGANPAVTLDGPNASFDTTGLIRSSAGRISAGGNLTQTGFPGVLTSSASLVQETSGTPSANTGALYLVNAGSPVDSRFWVQFAGSTGNLVVVATNDTDTVSHVVWAANRTGVVVTSFQIGSATDFPTIALFGATTISAAPSAIALTLTGSTSANALLVNGAASTVPVNIVSANTSAMAEGDLIISRPSTAANTFARGVTFTLQDIGGATLSQIQHGGGQFEFWQNTHQSAFFNTTFGLVINAPTSGASLDVTGVLSAIPLVVRSNNTSAVAFGDLVVTRASTTANAFAKGCNITLQDLAGSGLVTIQLAGGQLEFWQAVTQSAFFNTNRGLVLNPPAAGVNLVMTQVSAGIGVGILGSSLTSITSSFVTGARAMMVMNGGDSLLEFQASNTSSGYIYNSSTELRFAGRASVGLNFYSNDTVRISVAVAGNVSINAPASGICLNIFGSGTATTFQANNSTAGSGSSILGGFTNDVDADLNILISQSGAATKFATLSPSVNVPIRLGGFSTNTTAGIQGFGPVAAAYVDMTPDTATATVTCTSGMTTTPSVTATFYRVGKMVFMEVAALTGTGNNAHTALVMNLTYPTGFAPLANFKAYPAFVVNNGATVAGSCFIFTTGFELLQVPATLFNGTCGWTTGPIVLYYPTD